MDNKLIMSSQESAGLRCLLENHLTTLFNNTAIGKYLNVDGCEPELQIIDQQCNQMLPQIKLAFNIWLGMDTADRHNVLGKFHHLYASLPVTSPENRKTLVFCTLFVHELAIILAEAMQWPH